MNVPFHFETGRSGCGVSSAEARWSWATRTANSADRDPATSSSTWPTPCTAPRITHAVSFGGTPVHPGPGKLEVPHVSGAPGRPLSLAQGGFPGSRGGQGVARLHSERASLSTVMRTGESGLTVFRLLTKRAGWLWVQSNAHLVFRGGQPDCIVARQRALT